ncbi:hypothetical protein MNV49_002193 [Pseudohyphozyma bogoriensis]|nr:hypothetical protein MNV49_002193 [Pseudohyphozyma bogoriensis]
MLSRVASISRQFTSPLLARTIMSIPATQKALQIHEQGGLDVLAIHEIPVPKPGKGQVLYKNEYAGVNFIDTYQRGGIYKLAMPYVLGNESAGVVAAVGEGVTEADYGYKVGDRVVGYTAGGSFSEYVLNKAEKTVKIPEGVSTKEAATLLTQGLTALTFVKEAHEVKKGQYILVQAAAGGLGLLLVQLCKHFGAHVIGTTSTKEKAEIAKAAGADDVIIYGGDVNVAEEVYKITGGEGIDRGAHAVFDGVGKDTFDADFDILRRKGSLITLGNASGPVPPFAPLKLGPKNLKVARPVLNQYVHTKDEFAGYTKELFEIYQAGHLKLSVHGEYPLTVEGVRQSQEDIFVPNTLLDWLLWHSMFCVLAVPVILVYLGHITSLTLDPLFMEVIFIPAFLELWHAAWGTSAAALLQHTRIGDPSSSLLTPKPLVFNTFFISAVLAFAASVQAGYLWRQISRLRALPTPPTQEDTGPESSSNRGSKVISISCSTSPNVQHLRRMLLSVLFTSVALCLLAAVNVTVCFVGNLVQVRALCPIVLLSLQSHIW